MHEIKEKGMVMEDLNKKKQMKWVRFYEKATVHGTWPDFNMK